MATNQHGTEGWDADTRADNLAEASTIAGRCMFGLVLTEAFAIMIVEIELE